MKANAFCYCFRKPKLYGVYSSPRWKLHHIRRIIQVSVECQREIIPDVVRKMDRVIRCGWQGFISNDREMRFELRNFTVIWMEPSMRGKLRVGQLIEGLIESQRRFWETRELASFSHLVSKSNLLCNNILVCSLFQRNILVWISYFLFEFELFELLAVVDLRLKARKVFRDAID